MEQNVSFGKCNYLGTLLYWIYGNILEPFASLLLIILIFDDWDLVVNDAVIVSKFIVFGFESLSYPQHQR